MAQFRNVYVAEKGILGAQCLSCERIVFGHNDMASHVCPTVDEEQEGATQSEETISSRPDAEPDDDTSEWYRDIGTSGAG